VALVPALPGLPNADYPIGSWAYVTPSGPLSRVNSSGAWELGIRGQDIVADSITAGQIAAGAISTSELFAGEILVGAGGGKPTRFRVNDGGGSMVAFIGDNGAGFVGSYALNLRVGSNINAPFLYADAAVVRMGPNAISSPNIDITGSGVSILNATFKLTASDGTQTSINNDVLGGAFRGIGVYNSIGQSVVTITPGSIQLLDNVSSGTKFFLNGSAGASCSMALYNASNQQSLRFTINPSGSYPTLVLNNGITTRNGVGNAAPVTINYVKQVIGGIPTFGILEFTSGWLTNWT
jgi:hypothetical protein